MRLPTPRLRVHMFDGTTHELQAFNIDMVAYDRTRAKHKWPGPSDAPFQWLEFLAWHIMCKTQQRDVGVFGPEVTLAQFGEQIAAVEAIDDDEDDADDAGGGQVVGVDPTNQEVTPT